MALSGTGVTRLRRLTTVVGDAGSAERFFAEAFTFQTVDRRQEDSNFARLLGVPHARVTQTIMRLGDQEIGLLAFDPPGRPYPSRSTSTDLWFQHFAIIVADMAAAYDRLRRAGRFMPISEDGPQVLPPSSGSVSAFKFRDADGHPLELLAFPFGQSPAYWRAKTASSLFLGIDHSAVAVSDTARSVAFYEGVLGLDPGTRGENHGLEQARLDAVPGAICTVVGLHPAEAPTPHVELLGYQVGLRRPIPTQTVASDIAATTFVMETASLSDIVAALRQAQTRFISPSVVTMTNGERAIAVLDPDGHQIVVVEAL